ncbi:MAG: DEAD/DEAH box helicase [Syntrophorhabdales bacterium]|jgi:ATP-dependent RNA helicase DeaD
MQSTRFDELDLSREMQKAVADMGFETLTPIQSESIPPILEGKDVIGQAQTGTGKTLAFGLPIIEMLPRRGISPEAVILCPTRELAVQVAEELMRLAKYRRDLHIVPIYGGQAIQTQLSSLKRGARIIVGTPGRVMDHMQRGTLRFDKVRMVVLDEADKMLDMGFVDDMKTILWAMPEERQTLLFSATMPQSIMDLVRKFQKDPLVVNVVGEQVTVPEVEQTFFEVKPWMKLDVLCRLIDAYTPTSSLVFCNTKRRVDQIVRDLQSRGYMADSLHGDMTQSRRDHAMLKFRKKLLRILVATDVAARGIDVDNIEAVINYDLPQDDQYYVHRIGRTARMGKGGRAFTLVLPDQLPKLRDIQDKAKTRIMRQITPRLKENKKQNTAAAREPESLAGRS